MLELDLVYRLNSIPAELVAGIEIEIGKACTDEYIMPLFGKQNSDRTKICDYCGKRFEPKPMQPPQRFCSHTCYAENIRKIHVTKAELEYWYFELKMTSIEIAAKLGCNDRHLRQIMTNYGIPLRDKSDAAIDYPCYPFSGDLIEKAYLMGFRLGDMNVRKDMDTSRRLQVRSSSTVPAQVELICALFARYGHINLRTGSLGETQVECRVDLSFDFLLPKVDAIPKWAQNNDSCFWAFAAGYMDAEGHLSVRAAGTHWDIMVQIASCDIGILRDLHNGMNRRAVTCSLTYKRKTKTGLDFYCLTVGSKASLANYFRNVQPYLCHAEKRIQLERAMAILRA